MNNCSYCDKPTEFGLCDDCMQYEDYSAYLDAHPEQRKHGKYGGYSFKGEVDNGFKELEKELTEGLEIYEIKVMSEQNGTIEE